MAIPVTNLKASPDQDWYKASSEFQKYVIILPPNNCLYSPFETLELTQAYAEAQVKLHGSNQGAALIVPYTEWYTVPNLDDEGRPQPRPHLQYADA